MHDRRSTDEGHVLIGGTGRSGTTLLVQYFTALGFDTGFTADAARQKVDPVSHAGLEHSLGRTLGRGAPLPYVAKSPWFAESMGDYLARGELRVKAFVLPVRDLFEAAESRRSVSRRAATLGLGEKHPGGMIRARSGSRRQEEKLAVGFYKLVHALLAHEVPTYFLRFPEFVRGEQDLYAALEPLLAEHGVSRAESEAAFASVADPGLISTFTGPRPEGEGERPAD